MPYCTHQDILDRISERELIRLTDDEQTGTVNWDTVDAAIVRSDALIDSYASGRAALPLNPVSALATLLSADLTICDLWSRRRKAASRPGSEVDPVQEKCKQAVKMLEQIARGLLEIQPSADPAAAPADLAEFESAEQVFSRETLKGW